MKKIVVKIYFVLLCAITSINCFAESVYTLDPAKDIIIGSISLGLTVSSLFISRSASYASTDGFPLTKNDVNFFDGNLMFRYNKPLDFASDIALYGLIGIPVISLAENLTNKNVWLTYGAMYAESALLVFGTCEFFKNSIARYRPYCYFGDVPSGKDTDYYKSFPSRHTAFAFMSVGFFTSTFSAEYPDSPRRIPISIVSYSLAAAVGVNRILSGNHFISDVLTGAVLGSIYGYFIPPIQ
jgi:undecaprenyl-diphosphatase